MNLFVFEYFSAGAMAGTPLAASATPEGQAMLNALLRDFTVLPGCRTMTCLAPGMLVPHAHEVAVVSGDWEASFDDLAGRADYALVIAPEAGGRLADLSRRAQGAGARLLGSSPESILAASDKGECARLFRQAGIPAPETVPVTRETVGAAAREMGFPVVVKPASGQDCDGVSLVAGPEDLDRALALLEGREDWLLQRYQPGVNASASILVCGNDVTPLSLNGQRIEPGIPFAYKGGSTPLDHPQSEAALDLAARAARLFPGLAGFVGLDMVLTDDGCMVIEINPRVTVAYSGVSRSLDANLAEAILNAAAHGVLPERFGPGRRVEFDKGGRDV
ncbi:Carbamoyl-phosphate synthase large chain [Pseudodesulfovibrio hydrargyri]|uniref:Carbamoyl-phosphate synthase large chain n=1 Tax=Pseudodesulfovibrio hydrargyri TaxID=2125990 RepID=A0A1J5NIN3_9BACT|nr:ATP-grasp domain-containing protein [Pseudodesulfovibrio hydrargyri]OIQ51537.1 Carbamoyl-phosphate synthase large chain [Pseudodesulfovibrio hydrargyri]